MRYAWRLAGSLNYDAFAETNDDAFGAFRSERYHGTNSEDFMIAILLKAGRVKILTVSAVLLLLTACVFTAAWVRSLSIREFLFIEIESK